MLSLYLLAAALSLQFVTKETAFIYTAHAFALPGHPLPDPHGPGALENRPSPAVLQSV